MTFLQGRPFSPGYQAIPEPLDGSVVAIGNFDGVHRGHQALLDRLKQRAAEFNLPSVVYTFRPHPLHVLLPHRAPKLISTYDQKIALLSKQGVDLVVEEPFVGEFSQLSPEDFVQRILKDVLRARVVLSGQDFRFGHRGAGNVDKLREWGLEFGMEAEVFPPQREGDLTISSTAVRNAVSAGDLPLAARLLGRPMEYTGVVVTGAQRGRKLGFPTANMEVEQELLPPYGVYAGFVMIEGTQYQAVTNIGVRPTFDGEAVSVEAHVLQFEGDLYGKKLSLELRKRLRGEQKFESLETLQQQIQRDVNDAREVLSKLS